MSDKVERLVVILEYLLQTPDQAATLSEIVGAVDKPLSSTHDLLRAMVATGMLEVDANKRYHTGPVLIRLAIRAIDQVDIIATARPHLDRLVRDVKHDAYLAIRSGDVVSYVARSAGSHRAGLDIKLGEPVPLHSSAVGKLYSALQPDLEARVLASQLTPLTPQTMTDPVRLAAEFKEIRERDTSISIEETITGIVGFGAPVRDTAGRLIAAVHISAFKDNLADNDIARNEQAARACAAEIQLALAADTLKEVLT